MSRRSRGASARRSSPRSRAADSSPRQARSDVVVPGNDGRRDVVGRCLRSSSNFLVVNTNEIGAIGRMSPAQRATACHGRAQAWRVPTIASGTASSCPCQRPPWGLLHASTCRRRDIAWQVPLGDVPVLAAKGITGDRCPKSRRRNPHRRACVHRRRRRQPRSARSTYAPAVRLWRADLPASGHATPITYRGVRSKRQFVFVAAGGGGRFSKAISDAFVAFALPQSPN